MIVWRQLANRLALPPHSSDAAQLMLRALKLAVSSLRDAPPREDGRTPAKRAIMVAVLLADLSTAGVPLPPEGIAAAIVADAAADGRAAIAMIESELGRDVAELVLAVLRVRDAPCAVDLYDDVVSSALREMCLAYYDVRALVLEIVCKLDALQNAASLPLAKRHILALQVGLPVYVCVHHLINPEEHAGLFFR